MNPMKFAVNFPVSRESRPETGPTRTTSSAMQSVSEMCRNEVDESAPLVQKIILPGDRERLWRPEMPAGP